MPSANGVQYRTHGQAYRAGKEHDASASQDGTSNAESGEEINKGGGKIVAIKHNDGPPYHVKHEDGSVTQHDSKEDLISHLHDHIPGGEDEDVDNDGMDSDFGSEGSEEAIKTLLG
jgi:hypothetical protein